MKKQRTESKTNIDDILKQKDDEIKKFNEQINQKRNSDSSNPRHS